MLIINKWFESTGNPCKICHDFFSTELDQKTCRATHVVHSMPFEYHFNINTKQKSQCAFKPK